MMGISKDRAMQVAIVLFSFGAAVVGKRFSPSERISMVFKLEDKVGALSAGIRHFFHLRPRKVKMLHHS
jgi:hypothetical protein